jgi:hypothetical protein
LARTSVQRTINTRRWLAKSFFTRDAQCATGTTEQV